MVKLISSLSELKSEKILVVGDLILDKYTFGKVNRISPEAPVAIVQNVKEESRPGGAGNVILNLISLGAQVVPLGRVGNDHAGEILKKFLVNEQICITGIFLDETFQTPLKNRIIAENQQMLRIDYETITPIPQILENQIIAYLPKLLKDVKAIAISDYGKGFLSSSLIKAIIAEAKKNSILVIADPKGTDFNKYKGVNLIKPNLKEAYAASGLQPTEPLEKVAEKILSLAEADNLMITKGESGISIFSKHGERKDFATIVHEVKDVTGAGDTVLAMLTLALASGLDLAQASELCNAVAGIAIEHLGCARVTLSELSLRLLQKYRANKIFDEQHLFALKKALEGQNSACLSITSNSMVTPEFICKLNDLKENGQDKVLLSIDYPNPEEHFVKMLASLHPVDFVVVNRTKS